MAPIAHVNKQRRPDLDERPFMQGRAETETGGIGVGVHGATRDCRMGRIRVLDDQVIQRIAAGEVLQRPMNAVKELLENSLDATATRISICVQVPPPGGKTLDSSGLFSIQVTDNGSGIGRDDLELLCERHATSKLASIEDLRNVATFGFRGEALASCSQVARVEVVTRHRDADEAVAWRAQYTLGTLTGPPVSCAGNPGTTIHVRDLFYGNRIRREALLVSGDEYQKIVQVVQAYALDCAGRCGFSLSRVGRRDRFDVQTTGDEGETEVVRSVFGDEIAGALMAFSIDACAQLGVEGGSRGLATRTTFHKLRTALAIVFLNGRLIEHAPLRRAVVQAFAGHLPTAPVPAQPFIFLSLRIQPNRIDVNVHPSKKQVFFIDEAAIIAHVLAALHSQVLDRQYATQMLVPRDISIRPGNVRGSAPTRDAISVLTRDASNALTRDAINVSTRDASNVRSGAISARSGAISARSGAISARSGASNVRESANGARPVANKIAKISTLYPSPSPSQRVLTDDRNHRIDTFLFQSNAQPREIPSVGGTMMRGSVAGAHAIFNVEKLDCALPLSANGLSSDTCPPVVQVEKPTSTPPAVNMAGADGVCGERPPPSNWIQLTLSSSQDKRTPGPADSSPELSVSQLVRREEEAARSGKASPPLMDTQQLSPLSPLSESVAAADRVRGWMATCAHPQLSQLLQTSVVVGVIDAAHALLQSGTNLLLIRPERLSFELCFSLLLHASASAGAGDSSIPFLRLEAGVTLSEAFAEHWRQQSVGEGPVDYSRGAGLSPGHGGPASSELVAEASQLLRLHAPLLRRLFGVTLCDHRGDGESLCDVMLTELPLLMSGQRAPPVSLLRTFLLRLCLVPDYASATQEELLKMLAREIAQLLSLVPTDEWTDWPDYLTHVIFPNYRHGRALFTANDAFRQRVGMEANPPLLIITNTETLYKSFERC